MEKAMAGGSSEVLPRKQTMDSFIAVAFWMCRSLLERRGQEEQMKVMDGSGGSNQR